MATKYKEVTEEEFDEFIKNYPRKLESSLLSICYPEKIQFNDFTLGDWPDCAVADFNAWGHNPDDTNDIYGKEPCGWRILNDSVGE